MGCFGNNLTRAKAAAQANANANAFKVPYYVVSTTAGLYVERERPKDESLIAFVANPSGEANEDQRNR